MSSVNKILICACALVAFFGAVYALECYDCTALSNSDACGDDDFSSEKITTEAAPSIACKYCYKSKAKKDGVTVVIRGCLADLGVYSLDSCTQIETEGVKAEGCICSTNKCNGVGKLSGSILLVLAVALFKYMW